MPSLKSCAQYYRCPNLGKAHDSLIDTYITVYCFCMHLWIRYAQVAKRYSRKAKK